MTHDAIVGARYMDTVFNSQFVVIAVEADENTDTPPEASDITVVMEYEDRETGRIQTTDLDAFQSLEDIYVVDVPAHAQ